MARKRKRSSNDHNVNALEDCVLPEDTTTNILARLPVKSLLRCKSVCKSWQALIATPGFIKMHRRQFTDNPTNESFLINSLSYATADRNSRRISIFKIESKKTPIDLDLPFPNRFHWTSFVGSCNGLVCLRVNFRDSILLWNPATRLHKFVPPSRLHFRNVGLVSVGLGYDEDEDDFKVIRILNLKGEKTRVGVEAYSSNSNSWRMIQSDFPFHVFGSVSKCCVNGNPYWIAKDGEYEGWKVRFCLVWFDVKKMGFKKVSLQIELDKGPYSQLVNWKGSVGILVRCGDNIHIWVLDGEKTSGLPNWEIRWVRCLKNGKLLGYDSVGTFVVLNPENEIRFKVVEMKNKTPGCEVCEYSESLVYVEGMEQYRVH